MRIHDISMPLRNGMPVWPGDAAYAFKLNWQQSNGDSVNVGHLALSVHVGTHADSPFHVDGTGITIDQLPLKTFIGPAVVLDLSNVPTSRDIEPDDLLVAAKAVSDESFDSIVAKAPRLLLRTMSWPDRGRFPDDFVTLSEAAARLIVQSGAMLLGVDVPSVDRRESKTLPIHHLLIAKHRVGTGVQIVESLVLDAIRPGFYELFAPPLNVVGGDGAPARAVLIER